MFALEANAPIALSSIGDNFLKYVDDAPVVGEKVNDTGDNEIDGVPTGEVVTALIKK